MKPTTIREGRIYRLRSNAPVRVVKILTGSKTFEVQRIYRTPEGEWWNLDLPTTAVKADDIAEVEP